MTIEDALSENTQGKMRQIGRAVDAKRSQPSEDDRLADRLEIKRGSLTHDQMMTLLEIRQGQSGPRISHNVARSRGRCPNRFSWRIAGIKAAAKQS